MNTLPFTILKVPGKDVPTIKSNSNKSLNIAMNESIKKKLIQINKKYEEIKDVTITTGKGKGKPILLNKFIYKSCVANIKGSKN